MNAIFEKFNLAEKSAIVTGGGGGIGRAIAMAFADAGADLAIAEINSSKLKNTAKEIRDLYKVRVIEVELDVQNQLQVENLMDQCNQEFNKIDVLVNNAGIGIHKLPQDMTLDEWDQNLGVNLRSVFLCSKAVYPIMKQNGCGKIINIGSMYATFGSAALPAYAASKGGVVQLTRSLAIAWASDNIQVNALCPGFINSDLSATGKRDVPGMTQKVIDRTPAGRWGEPEDCAPAALFLASSAADFITGVSLPIDGGYSVN